MTTTKIISNICRNLLPVVNGGSWHELAFQIEVLSDGLRAGAEIQILLEAPGTRRNYLNYKSQLYIAILELDLR